MSLLRSAVSACALFLSLGTLAFAADPSPDPAPNPSPSAVPSTAPSPSVSPPAAVLPSIPGLPPGLLSAAAAFGAPAAPQAYTNFVRGADRQTGLIDIIRKDDDYYLDLGPEQFDRPYIFAPVLASGVGGGAFAGRIYSPSVFVFKKVGKRVFWINKNTSFFAPADTPAANALAISTTESIVNSFPIVAQDETKKRTVISAAYFLSDIENVGRDLGGPQSPIQILGLPGRAGYSADPSKSYIEKAKALPKNDEFLVSLGFSGGPVGPAAAPDGRGVRIRMHYSIVDAPSGSNYVPRLADDRVGYFITAQKHFDDDSGRTPFVRYIDRWNFNNGPLVYYLTNEIPTNYRPSIRAALLEWNKAFARVGIPNAIEVRDQPNDSNWDPDDARYSTVRWLTSDAPAFSAYGPSVADPRTGEIVRVEIVFDGESIRSIKRGFTEQVLPTRHSSTATDVLSQIRERQLTRSQGCEDPALCDDFAHGSADFAATGTLALRAAGASASLTEKYAEQWLFSVILHESGHNLGLRHNFAAAIYPLDELHDKRFTQSHGIVSSVMHYTPLNLSPPGKPQGDYFQLRLGPYDYWAIQYGYQKFGAAKPQDEAAKLRRIADQSTRPEFVYASDEDASGPRAVDPHVATYLLSRDALNFDRNQFQVVDNLLAKLDKVYPRDDRPYSEERAAFLSIMRQYQRAASLATRYIGGLYTSRSHRGQPGGVAPFRPVARADQRHAFEMLADNIFSRRALHFSPRLLTDLGPNNYLHRGSTNVFQRPDFEVSDYVATVQDEVMFQLLSPDVMSRIVDERLRLANPAQTMSLEDLFGWMQASVWDDLGGKTSSIDALHRNLQRRYTNYLIALSLAPSFILELVGFPAETASLAGYQLRRLDGRLSGSLHSARLDVGTRAHLEDMHDRVRHALNAGAVRGA